MKPYNLEVYIARDEIAARVRELGAEITRDFKDRNPILVSVLKGGIVFLADLMRFIECPHSIDFMTVSSYQGTTRSTGNVRILSDISTNIHMRDIIVVEDIYDTGLTLHYVLDHLKLRKPASICVCALLNKQKERTRVTYVKYAGFEIPDKFVVGYGLDYDEYLRNLPDICVLNFD